MVHSVFHVSMFKKFMGVSNPIVPLIDVNMETNLTYKEFLAEILDRQAKKLRNKDVVSIKVLLRN